MQTSVLKKTMRPDLKAGYSKSRGKQLLTEQFKIGQSEPKYIPTEERQAYREKILSFSLFPNIYNQKAIMTSLGSS